ncbi:hypothetical protein [Natronoglomus mannanivorans]|uniref:Uncharacterized protein n=1 Tax=Natronoglomus mannanivorans TaxID=2979990 RepID=A0AAP2Z584_9EURY|nr:hypothetical protein [Halobacteria archaeon AArc-xg1-1]
MVSRNGTVVYNKAVEVSGNKEKEILPEWSSEPAEYKIHYAIDDGVPIEYAELTAEDDESEKGDCMIADITLLSEERTPLKVRRRDRDPEYGNCA